MTICHAKCSFLESSIFLFTLVRSICRNNFCIELCDISGKSESNFSSKHQLNLSIFADNKKPKKYEERKTLIRIFIYDISFIHLKSIKISNLDKLL